MSSKISAPVRLDVDSSILENQLRLKDTNSDELSTLFPDSGKAAPWKLVTPSPGFCIKLRKQDDEKVFINICHTGEIPGPEDKTEAELLELLQSASDDDTCDYRIPMSIGEGRTELDKSKEPATVYDVALNSNFFAKLESSNSFRHFVIQVASQGVQEKFAIQLKSEEYVILKKRKVFGKLQQHRIQIRGASAAAASLDRSKHSVPLIQELGSKPSFVRGEGTGDGSPPLRQPPSRLFHDPSSQQLIAQFLLQGIMSSREVTLDLAQDRVVLTVARHGLRSDFYLPFNIDQDHAEAIFDPVSEMLTVKMPETSAC